MSGRTGHRRAAVLLALGERAKGSSALARETGLKYQAVQDILDSLCMSNLAEPHPDGEFVLGGGNVAEAVAEVRCDWGHGRRADVGGGAGLSERVRAALAEQPDLSLADLCVLVQSDDTSMVATLARMVRLKARRGNVQTIPKADGAPLNPMPLTCQKTVTCHAASLRASSGGAGGQ